MDTFYLTKEGIAQDYKRTLITFVVMGIIGGFVGLYAASGGKLFEDGDALVYLAIVAGMMLVLGIRVAMQAKRRQRLMQGVRLVVNEAGLVYHNPQAITYTIAKEKIKSIEVKANGKIKVRSEGNLPIHIPAFIERKEELLQKLALLHPVQGH